MELKRLREVTGPAKWLAFGVVAIGCLPAWGGTRDVVLLLNAHHNENQACFKYLYPPPDPHPNETSTCTDGDGDAKFLRQGRRTELRVFNRKFLTDYTLTVDAVTSIQTGPNIRNLSEAEALTFSAPSFAAPPPSKGGVEGLSPRTANTILFELLDETTATKPESDLRADFAVIDREHARIEEEGDAFSTTYEVLRGNQSAKSGPDCRKIAGSPDAESVLRCLREEFENEFLSPWDVEPYSDEDEFRNVNLRVRDLILAVRAFGTALASTDLVPKEQKLESDVAQYENDLVTFRGNVEAARDAAYLALDMNDLYRQRLSRERMKAILTEKLKAQGDTKPVFDEAGINELLNLYERSYAASLHVARSRWVDLTNATAAYLSHKYLALPPLTSEFHPEVASARQKLGSELPRVIDEVNAQQSKLLARVNEIYDDSEVIEPLSKQIDLSGHSGNLVVYYTIRRIEAFSRYTVTPVQGLGGTAQTNAAGTTLPLPAKGAAAAGAGTTNLTANAPPGTANPANPSSPTGPNGQPAGGTPADSSTGTVVARGQFEVHDIFDANVVAAFAFSTLKDQSISKQAQPQACGGSPGTPDNNCFAPVLNGNLRQFQPIVGLDYYFHHMDTFPKSGRCSKDMFQCLGLMGAVSVRKADSFYAGLFLEPVIGLQFAGGANIGTQTTLQSAYKFGSPVDITGDFPTYEKRATGAFFSAGLDLAIFRKIFGKVTGLGTSAANTQGK